MAKSKKVKKNPFELLANILILGALVALILIFAPILKEEIKYKLNKLSGVKYSINPPVGSSEKKLEPPNTDFSIVIPKIAAVAPIVKDVDPTNSKIYLAALSKGVAHAKGTSLPGEVGNTYLFAHSTDSFLNVGRYNAVFYLIGKLEKGDEVDVFYKGKLFKYVVDSKKVVSPDSLSYLGKIKSGSTLTLQTCYPPGTTLQRLVVTADLVK